MSLSLFSFSPGQKYTNTIHSQIHPYKDLPDREQLGSGALVPMGKAQIHWEPGVILPVPIPGLLYAVLLHRSAAILTGARVHLTLFGFFIASPPVPWASVLSTAVYYRVSSSTRTDRACIQYLGMPQ